MFHPTANNTEINMAKGFFFRVPCENPIHYRPYETRLNNDTYNSLEEATRTSGSIDATAIRHIARDIISPSLTSKGIIAIDGGWSEKRYSVIFEFHVKSPVAGHSFREVVMGYTNYDGITDTGIVDPNMTIHVNSHMRINDVVSMGHMGTMVQSRVAESSQMLNPVTVQQASGYQIAERALRPADALRAAQCVQAIGPNEVINDVRAHIGPEGIRSHRDNMSSARYLSKIMAAYSTSTMEDVAFSMGDSQAIGNASNLLVEQSNSRSSLLHRLTERTDFGCSGVVTYGELLAAFGNFDDRVEVAKTGGVGMMDMTQMNNHWGGSDQETSIAHSLTHYIPSIMSQNMASQYGFSVTNRTLDGSIQIATLPNFLPLIEGIDHVSYIKNIEQSIVFMAMPELMTNVGDFEIVMTCNLLGQSKIEISINGQPSIPFTAPNYADSITTPVVAIDPVDVARVGSDISTVLDLVHESQAHNYGY